MALDPMTSYEQAEAEADERFYEEREDRDMAAQEAQRIRRRALWNAKCRCYAPYDHCQCLDACETCGHHRIAHDYDGAPDTKHHWGCCDVEDCTCLRFEAE